MVLPPFASSKATAKRFSASNTTPSGLLYGPSGVVVPTSPFSQRISPTRITCGVGVGVEDDEFEIIRQGKGELVL